MQKKKIATDHRQKSTLISHFSKLEKLSSAIEKNKPRNHTLFPTATSRVYWFGRSMVIRVVPAKRIISA